MIEENFTGNLVPMLRDGDIDLAIIALPFTVAGVMTRTLYEEPFSVVVPEGHAWAKKKRVRPDELSGENLLVLNAGHCFREQVLEACPGQSNTAYSDGRSGSSLETIRNMVASGLGVSVLPATALAAPLREPAREGDPVRRSGAVAQGGRSPGAPASPGPRPCRPWPTRSSP